MKYSVNYRILIALILLLIAVVVLNNRITVANQKAPSRQILTTSLTENPQPQTVLPIQIPVPTITCDTQHTKLILILNSDIHFLYRIVIPYMKHVSLT